MLNSNHNHFGDRAYKVQYIHEWISVQVVIAKIEFKKIVQIVIILMVMIIIQKRTKL